MRVGGCKRWWTAVAAVLAFAHPALAAQERAAASAPPAAPLPRPAIWLIQDEDTKIYLFGTVHVFPASLRWRSAALERVIAEADELVMETPEASMDEAELDGGLLAKMDLAQPVPVLERVSPQVRPQLQAALEATGLPLAHYDGLHSWAVAFLLTGFQLARLGGEEEEAAAAVAVSGAEEQLGALFRARKRPISGVETVEQQLGIFSSMPEAAQRRLLEMTVTGDEAAAPVEEVANASWVRGDVEAIAAEMQTMPRELYEALLTRRNRDWAAWLERRMTRPGTVLFAVGAGHLAGPDSVQRMLGERGLRARRID